MAALIPLVRELARRQGQSVQRSQLQIGNASVSEPCGRAVIQRRRLGGVGPVKGDEGLMVAALEALEHPLQKVLSGFKVDAEVPNNEQEINPFGSDGFQCISCRGELSNAYMHCHGCETLLGRDYNICLECHSTGSLGEVLLSKETKACSTRLHCVPDPCKSSAQRRSKARKGRCKCKEANCRVCGLCVSCGCDCHSIFQLRYRFEEPGVMHHFVDRVVAMCGGGERRGQPPGPSMMQRASKGGPSGLGGRGRGGESTGGVQSTEDM
ncbi:unnamed protein product [Discosporangium mesarthrocarpum]